MKDLDLGQLETYLTLLRTGGFHETARQLGVSQSTVTQHIQKLEVTVGAALVVRSRSGCAPAPNTEPFARHAAALLRLASKTRRVLRRPVLTVGAASNIGIYILQPHLRRFRQLHGEGLDLEVVIDRNDVIADRLESGEIDLGAMEWWDDRRGLVARRWRKEPMVVIAPPDHPWARRKSITRRELVGQPMIGGEPHTGTGRILRRCLGAIADRLTIELTLNSTEAVKNAVRAGLGISIVLASAVAEEVEDRRLVVVPLEDASMAKELLLVHGATLPGRGHAARFVEMLLRGGERRRGQGPARA